MQPQDDDEDGSPASEGPIEVMEVDDAVALVKRARECGDLTKEQAAVLTRQFQEAAAFVRDSRSKQAEVATSLAERRSVLAVAQQELDEVDEEQNLHQAAMTKVLEQKKRVTVEMRETEARAQGLEGELITQEISKSELERKITKLTKENEARVRPKLDAMAAEVSAMRAELAETNSTIASTQEREMELMGRANALRNSLAELRADHGNEEKLLARQIPERKRIAKQVDVVSKALGGLVRDFDRYTGLIEGTAVNPNGYNAQLERHAIRKRDLEASCAALRDKLDASRAAVEQREESIDEQRAIFERRQLEQRELEARKMELQLQTREVQSTLKATRDDVSRESRLFDRLKRKLKGQIKAMPVVRSMVPGMETNVRDTQTELDMSNNSHRMKKEEQAGIEREIAVLMLSYLSKEELADDQREALGAQITVREAHEIELASWRHEEESMRATTSLLTAQRQQRAREASTAQTNEKTTRLLLKMRLLSLRDYTKRASETEANLAEFQKLYDVVRKERNRYVNLIQASNQALAEMTEKIRILDSEIGILRNEALSKDATTGKEQELIKHAQADRDGQRYEVSKKHDTYRTEQENVEQQIVEISKLNVVINRLERKMINIKGGYDALVEARNETGQQVIARNDELCILYERANVQGSAMQEGRKTLSMLDDELRLRSLSVAELKRQCGAVRKRVPQLPVLVEQVTALKASIAEKRELTQRLCTELETPRNQARWRELGGHDPTTDECKAKHVVLEERLNRKKTEHLEQELALDEITALTAQLSKSANEGREDALQLAQYANALQARIRESARKLMAVMSELSMYQGTALRLEQERAASDSQLVNAEERLGAGLAPTAEAEDQFRRMRVIWRRRAGEADRSAAMQDRNTAVAAGLVRTTAEPRPNACVLAERCGDVVLRSASASCAPHPPRCTLPRSHSSSSPPRTLQLHSKRPWDPAAVRWPRALQAHCRAGSDYGVDAPHAQADSARNYLVSAAANAPPHPPREVAAIVRSSANASRGKRCVRGGLSSRLSTTSTQLLSTRIKRKSEVPSAELVWYRYS
jgi:hypothetical protein